MRKSPLILALALAAALPASLAAQQPQQEMQEAEEAPPVLRLSFFQCHSNQIGDVMEQAETYDIPIWDELVAEGMVMNYGYFTHWWADEWNVGIYTIAPTIQAIVDASVEADRRMTERHPDAPDTMGEACPWHRDGFYNLGPSTQEGEEEPAGGGR